MSTDPAAPSDKAGESSSSARSAPAEASPPAKRAKIADFATALMRACSVELPPGEREGNIGEKEIEKADAKDRDGGGEMECGVFPWNPIFKKLGKMPTEKIINDW